MLLGWDEFVFLRCRFSEFNSVYKCNAILIQIPVKYFSGTIKLSVKIVEKNKSPWLSVA